MAQGSSNLTLNLNKLNGTTVSTSSGNSDSGTQRVILASDQPAIFVNSIPSVYSLSGVSISGTSGQFTCSEKDTTPLLIGQQITIAGTFSGTGSISGYTNPKAYVISQTNGANTFTLVTLTGSPIVTSVGTTTGVEFFTRGLTDFNIIGRGREIIASIDNKLSDGNQKSIIRGGAKGITLAADITSTSVDVNTQALDVILKGTGTNTIGKLAANDGIDIGDVTINNASIAVTDNGASLTVDAPVATPVYVRLSNGTSAVDALPVTDNGGSLTVDGSVSVSNFPATQPVSIATLPSLATGTNTIGKVDVNGTIPVSGTFWQATQPVSGTVGISGTVPISGALTDTQLRASPVQVSGTFWQTTQPVTGTVTVAQATAANLNATVVGTVGISNFPTTQAVSIATLPSLAAGTNNIGNVDVASLPGTVAADITAIKTATELLDNALGTDGAAVASVMLRVGGTDGTNNQTISVNTSGHINIADGGNSITVDGTFWQATQPVSIATLPSLAAGTNNIGAVSFSPNAIVANAPINATTTAYSASLVVKASAGVLYIVTGYNSRSSGQFIQIFDSATLPADTSVPKVIFYVESNSNFSFDLGVYGRAFSSGIVICNSSTGPTKKIGAADCWFDVQYE